MSARACATERCSSSIAPTASLNSSFCSDWTSSHTRAGDTAADFTATLLPTRASIRHWVDSEGLVATVTETAAGRRALRGDFVFDADADADAACGDGISDVDDC